MNKLQKQFLWAGILGGILCGLGAVVARQQFLISYLFAYLFWFGIAIGCLGLLLLHQVTGGAWGDLVKPQMKSSAATLPFLAVLFIPVLFGLKVLYPWARPEIVLSDPILQHKHIYLNIPFFCLRAALYFSIWTWMAYRFSGRESAGGLILYMFTLSFAAIDWMMSIDPRWFSTMYGVLVMISAVLSALAFLAIGLRLLQNPSGRDEPAFIKPYLDLGNMLLAFVMFWAYVSFSQYLIIWSANLPEEIPWYLHRQEGGRFWVAMVLVVFQFVLPFLVLLGRRNKQKLERLAWVAAVILGLGVLHMYWLIQPSYDTVGVHLRWTDAAAFVGVGGLWLAVFIAQLKKQPAPVGAYRPEGSE